MNGRICLWLSLAIGVVSGGWADANGLEFDQLKKEIHAPADAKLVVQEFSFKNTSGKSVKIKKYDSGCSCMSAEVMDGKLEYAPGETGVIRAKFDMGNFYGHVDKVISLWVDQDAEDKPSIELTTHVVIPELIKPDQKTLKWVVGKDAKAQRIKLAIDYQKPIQITGVTSATELFDYKLITVEEGKAYELEVTPKSVKTPGMAIFRLTTDCKIDRFKVIQLFAQVRNAES